MYILILHSLLSATSATAAMHQNSWRFDSEYSIKCHWRTKNMDATPKKMECLPEISEDKAWRGWRRPDNIQITNYKPKNLHWKSTTKKARDCMVRSNGNLPWMSEEGGVKGEWRPLIRDKNNNQRIMVNISNTMFI